MVSDEEISNIEKDIEKGEEKLIEKNLEVDKRKIEETKTEEEAKKEEIKKNKAEEKKYEAEKDKEGAEKKKGRFSRMGEYTTGLIKEKGNGLIWLVLFKHIFIDGLFASILGYGWYGYGWYSDFRMYLVDLFFLGVFWFYYLRGEETDNSVNSNIRTFLIALFIFMLDTQFLQKLFAKFVLTSFEEGTLIFGIFYTSRWLFPWWLILIVFTSKTDLARKVKVVYVAIVFMLVMSFIFSTDLPTQLANFGKNNVDTGLQTGDKLAQQSSTLVYIKTNYQRSKACILEFDAKACADIGKPAPKSEAEKKKEETTILQGGTDNKLTQQMSMKLTASRNSPSNVWEKEIIASATLEASAATRDVPIDLSCGLKDSKGKEIEKSGIINPMQVFVKYQNLVGTYELLTCTISKPQELKKGTNIVYFKADINNQLQLNSYLIAYFIENTELENQLNYYLTNDASAKESFISTRASKGIGEAQKQVYSRLYKDIILNDYPDGKAVSKSEVGFAKTDIVIGDIPIVGIENGKEVNLQIAIENMIDGGKITDVTGGEITLPSWLLPVEGKCPLLLDGIPVGNDFSRYSFDTEILKNIKWTDIKKGPENQKKLTPCTLKVNVNPKDILYNPNTLNPEVIQTRTFYNYEMEADGVLNVEEADLSKVQKFNPPSDIYGDTITAPVPADAGVKASDVSVFGLPGYRGIVKNGISINAPEGSEVHSVTEGRVINKGCNEWGGNYITIQNNGNQFVFTYAYLNDTTVNITDTITINQIIGHVGTTAGCIQNCDDTKKLCGLKNKVTPQLYFGVYEQSDGKPLNPYCALQKAYGVPKASGC